MADFLIMRSDEHGIMIDRYTADGEIAGDTWHRDLEEARYQAEFEYGNALSDWEEIPADIEDEVSFGMSKLAE